MYSKYRYQSSYDFLCIKDYPVHISLFCLIASYKAMGTNPHLWTSPPFR